MRTLALAHFSVVPSAPHSPYVSRTPRSGARISLNYTQIERSQAREAK